MLIYSKCVNINLRVTNFFILYVIQWQLNTIYSDLFFFSWIDTVKYRNTIIMLWQYTVVELSLLSWLVFYVTFNDISVIYVTATDMQAYWRRSCTYMYGRGPNAIDISHCSLTCPSYTDKGPSFLYGDSDTPPHLVAFYDTLGRRRMYSRLKPPASSRGSIQ